jgi:prepilin-type N-terminal cleavage/methylation domain-containing protein
MKIPGNNSGFTLIELIVTALVINILAAIAIVGYIGTIEKSRVSRVIRTASTATADLQLWLQSSLSHKRDLRELDTNLDGIINDLDKTNEELFIDGVADTYIDVRTTVMKDASHQLETATGKSVKNSCKRKKWYYRI